MRTLSAAQTAVRAANVQADSFRVQIKDSGGTFRDLTTYPGFNAVKSIRVSDGVDSPHMTADVELTREFFKLSLSPFVTGSALNRGFNPAASPVALIAIKREFKIEVAITAVGRAPEAGDWFEVFRGRVDYVNPANGATIQFGGRDLAGRIADQQIKKERVYAFAEVGGLAVTLRPWEAGMVVAVGEYMLPASNSDNDSGANKFFVCDTAGTTGSSEPTWSTGANITDGSARWDYVGAPTVLGLPVEEVIQNLLDVNKATADSSVTLYTPTSPSWAITQYLQSRDRNLQAIRALANQIGWDCRMKWRSGTSQFELTLFEPERTKATVDYTFAANTYEEPTKLETSIENIRNSWRVTYSDTADLWPDGSPKRKVIEVSDSTSITEFGELWAEISEASNSNVNTSTEATKLANAALSDCAYPTADFVVRTKQAFPWVELGDRYTFSADGRRYDFAQTFAVTGWQLTGEAGKLATEFQMRGKPSLGVMAWLAVTTTMPFVMSELQPAPKYTHFPGGKNPKVTTLRTPGGVSLKLSGDTIDGKSLGDTDYEIHVSTSSGFTPSSTTLKGITKGKILTVDELDPSVTYYGKVVPRLRDRGGRLARGQPGAQFTITPSRVKAGLVDRHIAVGVPNSDFKDCFDPDPENSTTAPQHWTLAAGSFGPTGDARNVLDGTYGMVLSLRQTGTSAILDSPVFKLRATPSGQLHVRAKPTGTLSAGRNLHIVINYYADEAAASSVGSYDTVVPYNNTASGTWGLWAEDLVVPDGASYAQIRFYKDTASSAYGWDVANMEITESVLGLSHVRAKTSSAGSYPNNTAVVFGTVDYDTLGEYDSSTGIFTATIAGRYQISATCLTGNIAWVQYNSFHIGVVKNSTTVSYGFRNWAPFSASFYQSGHCSTVINLAVGDTLKIVMFHDRGAGNVTLYTDASFNHLSIDRLV